MIEYTLFFADPDTVITGRGAEHLFRTMDIAETTRALPFLLTSALRSGSKTTISPCRSASYPARLAKVRCGSKCEILRLSIALPGYLRKRTFGPCRHSAFRRSGNGPCRRHASPAHGPCNPHKFRQPDNLSANVRNDRLNQSAMPLPPKPLAFVGLVGIFPSGLAATPRQWFKRKNISAIRLTTPGVSTEGSIGLRQRSRVSTPIALVALPGDSGGALRARPEQPTSLRATERATQFGSVGPAGISESRSPCREYVDRFKTSDERLRERSGRDGSEWPCASTHRCNGGHRARSTEDPRITRTKTELGSHRRGARKTRRRPGQ